MIDINEAYKRIHKRAYKRIHILFELAEYNSNSSSILLNRARMYARYVQINGIKFKKVEE